MFLPWISGFRRNDEVWQTEFLISLQSFDY